MRVWCKEEGEKSINVEENIKALLIVVFLSFRGFFHSIVVLASIALRCDPLHFHIILNFHFSINSVPFWLNRKLENASEKYGKLLFNQFFLYAEVLLILLSENLTLLSFVN